MKFQFPEAFYLVMPWTLFVLIVLINQGLAFSWLKKNIFKRFLTRFTRYNPIKLIFHVCIIFLEGFVLIWTLAGPYDSGQVKHTKMSRNIFLVLDSSFSMAAIDTYMLSKDSLHGKSRFEAAKEIAVELADNLKEDKIGLITFSGSSVIHATPTWDHSSITSLVKNLSLHSLQGTGSDFSKPLAGLIHTVEFKPDNYTVIIISDGEPLPKEQDFRGELDTLNIADVPILTIGIGTSAGANISIFDPEDVYNKMDHPKVLKVVNTYRTPHTLKVISSRTGGKYFELEKGIWIEDVIDAIKTTSKGSVEKVHGKVDSSHIPLIIFLFLFFLEIIYLYPKKANFNFIGLLFMLGILSSCETKLIQAHKENETGIEKYEVALYDVARSRFEKSSLYRMKEEIPLFNLGNDYVQKKEYSTAHHYFQRSIKSNPDRPETYFNDGVALFLWGEDEVDPKGCFLAKASQLFDEAIERFKSAQEKGLDTEKNIAYVKKRIADMYELHYNATECPPPQSSQNNYQSKHAPPPPQKQQQQQQQQQQNKQNQQHDQQQQKTNLTEDEKKETDSNLKRINDESQKNTGFKQTGNQQTPKEKENLDQEVLW